jgi:hypothetical protein
VLQALDFFPDSVIAEVITEEISSVTVKSDRNSTGGGELKDASNVFFEFMSPSLPARWLAGLTDLDLSSYILRPDAWRQMCSVLPSGHSIRALALPALAFHEGTSDDCDLVATCFELLEGVLHGSSQYTALRLTISNKVKHVSRSVSCSSYCDSHSRKREAEAVSKAADEKIAKIIATVRTLVHRAARILMCPRVSTLQHLHLDLPLEPSAAAGSINTDIRNLELPVGEKLFPFRAIRSLVSLKSLQFQGRRFIGKSLYSAQCLTTLPKLKEMLGYDIARRMVWMMRSSRHGSHSHLWHRLLFMSANAATVLRCVSVKSTISFGCHWLRHLYTSAY